MSETQCTCGRCGLCEVNAYIARLEEERDSMRRALTAWVADLTALAAACGQRDDEYPRKAVERRLAELTAKANELPGLTATIDELFCVVASVRVWAAVHARSVPSYERESLASILDSAPRPPAPGGK